MYENVNVLEKACVREKWSRDRDTHKPGGRYNSASTLPDCKSNCIDDSTCTGFDWVPYSSSKCWFHGPWSANYQKKPYPRVDHYELIRDASCGKPNTLLASLIVAVAVYC